jgi:hypothetical protein
LIRAFLNPCPRGQTNRFKPANLPQSRAQAKTALAAEAQKDLSGVRDWKGCGQEMFKGIFNCANK